MAYGIDRMRALAEGPGLDMPPASWEAPEAVTGIIYPFATWGAGSWEAEPDVARGPRVDLYAYDVEGPFLSIDDVYTTTVAEAKILLSRLASAVAMAEELSR